MAAENNNKILFTGPTNYGKTFLLKPSKEVYKERLSGNLSSDKFGWVGSEKAIVILSQDFRWNKDSIQWDNLLLLFEGNH